MTVDQACIGNRVRTLVDWPEVPAGTEGVIDEDYGTGVMVAWDLPNRPLPANYEKMHHLTALQLRGLGILRDGFSNKDLRYLEIHPKYAAEALNRTIREHDLREQTAEVVRNVLDWTS